MKKFIFLFIVFRACIDATFAITDSGTCGDNLTWSLDRETKQLTIIGSGEMTNYSNSGPWVSSDVYTIILPEGLTHIGNHAFSSCDKVVSLTLPKTLISIGEFAFSHCTSLTAIDIPDNVSTIGVHAFYYCLGLETISIGKNVSSIASTAFESCRTKTVHWNAKNYINSIEYSTPLPTSYLSKIVFGDEVEAIPDRLCSGSKITSATIPYGVQYIGKEAFYNCSSLESVFIPNSILTIGDKAFLYCTSLQSINIPNSVTTIGEWAFAQCTNLQSAIIGNSVDSIRYMTFGNCSSLTSVSIGNSVREIGEAAFYYCTAIPSVDIPNNVSSIKRVAFDHCTSLNSIIIGNGVQSIGEMALFSCSGLASITCNAVTPPTLGNNVFLSVVKTIPLYVPINSIPLYKEADQWKDFYIPTSLEEIPSSNERLSTTKILHNGKVLLYTKSRVYDTQGQLVKTQ